MCAPEQNIIKAYKPKNPCQLPDSPNPSFRGGDMVNHCYGQDSVKTVILVRQRHVITD